MQSFHLLPDLNSDLFAGLPAGAGLLPHLFDAYPIVHFQLNELLHVDVRKHFDVRNPDVQSIEILDLQIMKYRQFFLQSFKFRDIEV